MPDRKRGHGLQKLDLSMGVVITPRAMPRGGQDPYHPSPQWCPVMECHETPALRDADPRKASEGGAKPRAVVGTRRPAPRAHPVADQRRDQGVVGTDVDPVTSRFSVRIGPNSGVAAEHEQGVSTQVQFRCKIW
jgi:hypothetical protein